MKPFWRHFFQKKKEDLEIVTDERHHIVKALYTEVVNFYGKEKFILKANRVNAFNMVGSDKLELKLTALERILYADPDLKVEKGQIEERIQRLEDKLADLMAERIVEKNFEKQVTRRMREKQREYIKEIEREIINERKAIDNPGTLRRLAQLEKMEAKGLNRTTLDLVRPQKLSELVGQDTAIKSLVSKIASPYPQHVILYGPPGVGKTTAARLALEEAWKRKNTPFYEDSRFIEVDGTTLRWDPREVTNPLLGSVHDPIYQGARRSLVDDGVPEPKTGLVTEAHGGILFIDEIGELEPMLQNKLLKVMEDKRVTFESSYYDSNDERIPLYIKKLFEEGAPADFIMIGATTRSPESINPAFRSRCAEVFFNPLSKTHIQEIILNAVKKLEVQVEEGIPEIISDYTIEGRTAINLLLDAYSLALYENNTKESNLIIKKEILYEALQNRRMTPYNRVEVSKEGQIGKVYGLGVHGFIGSVIEIEAVAFSAEEKGKGKIRFNETAGSMTKDSLFNAAVLVRKLTGKNLADYDLHVNIVGGGNVDGPSAGVAILLAIISAIEEIPLRQDLAVTGEVSIQGKVKAVGGIREKLHAAQQAGLNRVLIPYENRNDLAHQEKPVITTISTVEEALKKAFTYKSETQQGNQREDFEGVLLRLFR